MTLLSYYLRPRRRCCLACAGTYPQFPSPDRGAYQELQGCRNHVEATWRNSRLFKGLGWQTHEMAHTLHCVAQGHASPFFSLWKVACPTLLTWGNCVEHMMWAYDVTVLSVVGVLWFVPKWETSSQWLILCFAGINLHTGLRYGLLF